MNLLPRNRVNQRGQLWSWPYTGRRTATLPAITGALPLYVDCLPPPLIVAVASVPSSLFASFPSLAHVIRIGFEKALCLKCLQPAVDFNPRPARAFIRRAMSVTGVMVKPKL